MTSRKYIKTKFEGVFYRLSSRRDARTGEADRIYAFWYADAEGKGHWKTVGRHSQGVRPQTARNERAEFLTQLGQGVNPVLQENVTVGDAVEAYITWASNEGKYISRPKQQYEKHMRHRLHMVPILAVTAAMLSSIKADLAATPADLPKPRRQAMDAPLAPPRMLSPQTIAHQFAFLRRAVYRAMATGLYVGPNPFASRQSGPWKMPRVDNARQRFLSREEARLLLDELALRSRQVHDMAFLALHTGLRATEIFRLRGQDVDEHAGVLHITAKGGAHELVPAPPEVLALLQGYGRTGGEYIFQERGTDGPLKRTSHVFEAAVRKLGLDDGTDPRFRITFHTLRHTFASWLAQSGKVSLLELKKLMRHESLVMTQRYAHLIPGQEREKLAIISDMLNSHD